ncbi:MAG TPA: hypothetical protein VMF05_14250 [Stellaceae bacterium]|nr:hypothetical protein [Stellaceae bacterium]
MIDRLALPLLLLLCGLFAAVVVAELRPASTEPAQADAAIPAPKPLPAPPLREADSGYDTLMATTLARPLFSSTRRPPVQNSGDAADDSGLADTRLAGILIEPGHRIAIFAPTGAKAVTVTQGQTVGSWRVDSITPVEVSLSGPDGTKTLQPKFDPNLVPPATPPFVNRPAEPGGFAVARPGVRPGLPPGFNRAPFRPGERGRP